MIKWILLGGFLAVAVGFGMSFVSHYNAAVGYETTINAMYKDNQNVLASVGQKVFGTARVADKYKAGVVEAIQAAITGRYGGANEQTGETGGSRQAMLWVKEQNPTLDPMLYGRIQNVIEAGQDEFKNNQKTLLDACRIYEKERKSLYSGFMLKLAGFPSQPEDEKDVTFKVKCTPITSQLAEDSFKSGKQTEMLF